MKRGLVRFFRDTFGLWRHQWFRHLAGGCWVRISDGPGRWYQISPRTFYALEEKAPYRDTCRFEAYD